MRVAGVPEYSAKFSDVVVAQDAGIEQDTSTSKLAGFGGEHQLASHAKVHKKHATVELENDEFAVTAYVFNAPADDDWRRNSFYPEHYTARQDRAQAADDGFYFG